MGLSFATLMADSTHAQIRLCVHPKDTEVAGLAKALSAVQAIMQDIVMCGFLCMAPKSELQNTK